MVLGDPLFVVSRISAALDQLGVRYVVGGSVASSVYGIPRATQDVDVVAELYGKHVDALVEARDAGRSDDRFVGGRIRASLEDVHARRV